MVYAAVWRYTSTSVPGYHVSFCPAIGAGVLYRSRSTTGSMAGTGIHGAARIVTGSLGSTHFFTYIILWVALPVALTSAENWKCAEACRPNSIRNFVKEDLESFIKKHRTGVMK